MKKYIFLITFLINCISFTQIKELAGVVLDKNTREPLSNVLIFDHYLDTTYTNGEKGKFNFKFNQGSNKLTFKRLGYNDEIIYIQNLKMDEVTVFLEEKFISTQSILITGNLFKETKGLNYLYTLSKNEINSSMTIQDIPEFLSSLPSTTFYSESGNSVGYSYINIRGFDQRRISIAVNGVTQNDPEDHNVYWVDFPDILSNSDYIQVQRASGLGMIGYPSIGGSINIITSYFSHHPFASVESYISSYNTLKNSFTFSSGKLPNNLSIYGRIGKINTDGYRDNAWSDLINYYFSVSYLNNNFTTQVNMYGGIIKDGLVYYGLPKFAIKDKSLRIKNFSYWEADKNKFKYTSERNRNEQESFSQPHFEILNEINFSDQLKFNSALYYIFGEGYYDYDASWGDTSYFRINYNNGFTPQNNPENVLVRAYVKNNQLGWSPKFDLDLSPFQFVFGGEAKFHSSSHNGKIINATKLPDNYNFDYEYYSYNGKKSTYNLFLQIKYLLNNNFNLTLEGQYSYLSYRLYNEKFLNYDFSIRHHFFNTKLGVIYFIDDNINTYFTFSNVSREPRLKNYYDAAESSGGSLPQFELDSYGNFDYSKPLVKPETMYNFELGGSYTQDGISFGLNFYYMLFTNEIVKNGKIDRFGQPITGNAKKSLHTGIEFTIRFNKIKNLELLFNLTYSNNYFISASEYINSYAFSTITAKELILDGNKISGFPDLLMNFSIKYNFKNLNIKLDNRYVGSYFSDNYDTKIAEYLDKYPAFIDYNENKVDEYFVSNLSVNYTFYDVLNTLDISLYTQLNNIFNNYYAAMAFGKEFFPAADRNYIFGIKLNVK